MRIVQINDLSRPQGGASALATALAEGLARRGSQVTFLCGDEGANSALADAGVDIHGLGSARLLDLPRSRALLNGLYNHKAHRLVASWIGQHDTPQTVYHVHGWAQILSPSIFAALAPVRHRTVLSAHDFFLACPNGAFVEFSTGEPCLRKPLSLSCLATGCDRRGGLDKAWRVLRHAMLGRWLDPAAVPMILTIHAAMLPYFERAGFPRQCLETLPNPVTPWSETRIPVEQNRKALFVGRLEATKGPDLAAAAAVAAGVELHVLGDGAMRPELEARYPSVRFHGRCGFAEIAGHARTARMLLMPSRYPEPFGLAAAEALASGLPVVLAESAFLAADIVAGGAGLAVPPRDTGGFARAIAALAADDALAGRMSRAAPGVAARVSLSMPAWLDRTEAAYGRVLAGQHQA